MPSLQELNDSGIINATTVPALEKRASKIMRMPTKTELLLEKSNFHRIRNYEKMSKMKEEMQEEKTKQKTLAPVLQVNTV